MEQQVAEQVPEPAFELMAQREAGMAKKARRAKPAAKTLLPEDHHYKVENLNRYALRPRNAIIAASSGDAAGAAADTAAGTEVGADGGGAEMPAFDGGDDGFDGFSNGESMAPGQQQHRWARL